MVKVDRKFLLGFSLLLLVIAGTIAVTSPLYWTVDPPKPVLKYARESYGSEVIGFNKNESSIVRILDDPYLLAFTYLENGSIYAPEKLSFFNFSFTALNTSISSDTFVFDPQYQNLIGYCVGFYFYLFNPINSTYNELLKTQNKTYSFDSDNSTHKDIFYWNSFSSNNYLSSSLKKQFLFYEFIIQLVGRYNNGSNEYNVPQGTINWSAHVQYHIDTQNKLIFDKIKNNSVLPYATFTYIKWGMLNFAVLTGGFVFIALSIIILVTKEKSIKEKN